MHFQYAPRRDQARKLSSRRVFDIAVDIRQGSPTFLRWHGQVLSPYNHNTLIVMRLAHGFQTLTDECEMLCLHSSYRPEAEGGLNTQDPRLSIDWPYAIAELSPRVPLTRC
jgi:dTDP-4-dehydrorhamnose 3,5-epimerase